MRKLAPLKVATIFLACLYDYGSRLVKVIDLGMPWYALPRTTVAIRFMP